MNKVVSAAPPRSHSSRLASLYLKKIGLRNVFLVLFAVVAIGLAIFPNWATNAGLPPLLLLSLPGLALLALGTCNTRSSRHGLRERRHGATGRYS